MICVRHDERNVFFFNDTATTEIYTLSLHDALPICGRSSRAASARHACPALPRKGWACRARGAASGPRTSRRAGARHHRRSEEHTSELQSRQYLVCRLLLEKKKNLYIILLFATPFNF